MNQSVIDREIRKIAKENGGRLTPALLTTIASDPDHPLHDCFDWNETTAAQKWREHQARQIIRSVEIEVTHHEIVINVPEHVRDPRAGKQQGYVQTLKIADEKDIALEALHQETKRAMAAMTRARDLGRTFGLETEFEELLERLSVLRSNL